MASSPQKQAAQHKRVFPTFKESSAYRNVYRPKHTPHKEVSTLNFFAPL
jgi:hypothetical protein